MFFHVCSGELCSPECSHGVNHKDLKRLIPLVIEQWLVKCNASRGHTPLKGSNRLDGI